VAGFDDGKIRSFAGRRQPSNRAFSSRSNRPSGDLKIHRKTPFIQYLIIPDFALVAHPLSWQK
jgi:hypothetical protein